MTAFGRRHCTTFVRETCVVRRLLRTRACIKGLEFRRQKEGTLPLTCACIAHSLVIGGGTHRARLHLTLSLQTSWWRLRDAARHLDAFSVPSAGTLS